LVLIPALLYGVLRVAPYAWSWTMWNSMLTRARSVQDFTSLPADASYSSAVAKLGQPLYSGPGFANSSGLFAGVYYWHDASGADIRGLVIDWAASGHASAVGRLKAGAW
jgi:hypothetical protein